MYLQIRSCYGQRLITYKKIHYLTFDLEPKIKVIQNVAQYILDHVTSEPENVDVAKSHGSGEDAFTRKINYLTLTLGSRS